jgi:hypothetical protein
MDGCFAAIWLFDAQATMHVGDAAVEGDWLHLLDIVPGDVSDWAMPLTAVAAVRVARFDGELGDVTTVVLELADRGRVRICALGAGATSELADLLTHGVQAACLAD